jgi:hypothetical protein
MSETPNNPANWGSIAVVLLAAFTAFIQAWSALNGADARQDLRLSRIESLLCTTADPERKHTCELVGIKP